MTLFRHSIRAIFVLAIAVSMPSVSHARSAKTEEKAAFALLSDAARAGDAEAQFELGERYANGDGIPQDTREAVLWWIKATRQAHPEAAARVAAAIESGQHLPRDPDRAETFWKRAAEWGSASAQWRMAEQARDPSGAMPWIRQAARQGYPPALHALARHYEEGRYLEKNERRAWDLYHRAARAGHPRAMNTWGVLVAEGVQGEPDYATAYFWFRLADLNGAAAAQNNMDEISSRISFRERRRLRRHANKVFAGHAEPL